VHLRIAENGEILFKGPTVTKGYYNKPQKTASSFIDGWFRTDDVGVLDNGPQLIETTIGRDFYKEGNLREVPGNY